MHAATLKSDRLQRVLSALQRGRPMTTMEIIQAAGVCAVNSIVSELRRNGVDISCTPIGKGVYAYRLEGQ